MGLKEGGKMIWDIAVHMEVPNFDIACIKAVEQGETILGEMAELNFINLSLEFDGLMYDGDVWVYEFVITGEEAKNGNLTN
jgi:hypothetical protein